MTPPTLECEGLINGIEWNYSNQLNSSREQWSIFNSDLSAPVEPAAQCSQRLVFIEYLQLGLSATDRKWGREVSEHTEGRSWLCNKKKRQPAFHDLSVSFAEGWMRRRIILDKTFWCATVWGLYQSVGGRRVTELAEKKKLKQSRSHPDEQKRWPHLHGVCRPVDAGMAYCIFSTAAGSKQQTSLMIHSVCFFFCGRAHKCSFCPAVSIFAMNISTGWESLSGQLHLAQ